jgi:DNA-cytosine methyltransferase
MCDITGVSSDARAPRILKVGTDFSGMEMPLMALDKLGVAYEHRFSSDSAKHCRTYIEAATQPGICYATVCGRTERTMPYVDTYVFSPPCQPYSKAGKGAGVADPSRGQLVKHSLKYMKVQKPRLAIMEQVATIMDRHPKMFKKITHTMQKIGYKVFWKRINTSQWGVPQNRERVYVVAIKKSSYKREFKWPKTVPLTYTVEKMIVPQLGDDNTRLPSKMSDPRARVMVKRAYMKCKKKNINPKSQFVTVDVDCSEKFASHGTSIHPCLTATRDRTSGWWWSLVGRRAALAELCQIQGVQMKDLPSATSVTAREMGHMLGNSMSLNVIERVLGASLWSAGLIAARPKDRWCDKHA